MNQHKRGPDLNLELNQDPDRDGNASPHPNKDRTPNAYPDPKHNPDRDLIRELRGMTLASRLKRLGDRLKGEATRVYHDHGIEFNDSWFLVAVVLSREETASVKGMAESLGVSHSAISQMATAMERSGLLTSTSDAHDRRRSVLRLTDKGRETVTALEPLWRAVGECTDALVAATGHDLIGAINGIEEQLRERTLSDRVSEGMSERVSAHASEHAAPHRPEKGE